MTHEPVLPCVVCGAPDHEGYWDHDEYGLLTMNCANARRPDVAARVAAARQARILARQRDKLDAAFRKGR